MTSGVFYSSVECLNGLRYYTHAGVDPLGSIILMIIRFLNVHFLLWSLIEPFNEINGTIHHVFLDWGNIGCTLVGAIFIFAPMRFGWSRVVLPQINYMPIGYQLNKCEDRFQSHSNQKKKKKQDSLIQWSQSMVWIFYNRKRPRPTFGKVDLHVKDRQYTQLSLNLIQRHLPLSKKVDFANPETSNELLMFSQNNS